MRQGRTPRWAAAAVLVLLVAASSAVAGSARAATTVDQALTACTGQDAPAYARTAEALVAENQKDRAEQIYRAVIFRDPEAECAVRGLAALTQARSAERSLFGRAGDSWDRTSAKYVQPALAPLLGLIIGVAVAATVAGVSTGLLTRFKARSRGRRRRAVAEVVGVVVMCVGVAAVVAAALVLSAQSVGWSGPARAAADWPLPVSLFWTLLLLGLAVTVVGIVLYSAALGRRLKLALDVRDGDGTADLVSAQYLLGRLTALGSEAPKGLRTPENTDVTSLPESAVSILRVTGVAGALLPVLRALRRPAPWRATVGLVDGSTVVVTLTRNGKAIPNWTTTLHQLGLPNAAGEAAAHASDDAWPDATRRYLLTAAASYVLLEISHVDDDLRRGLCGARNPTSLAMRLIATDESSRLPDAVRLRLLERAVAVDPASGLALVALLGVRGLRRAEQAPVARAAAAALTRIQDMGRGYVGMRLRLTNILTVARLNALLLLKQADPVSQDRIHDAKVETAQAAMALVRLLQSSAGEAHGLRQEMRVTGGYLVLDINSQLGQQRELDGWSKAVELAERWVRMTRTRDSVDGPPPLPAEESYSRACYECSRQGYADWAQRALADVRVAATDARLRAWAREDPSLEPLRREPTGPDDEVALDFQRIVGDPPARSFFDLAVFDGHRDTLRSLGLTGPKDLVDLDPDERAQLGVPTVVLRRWERIAELALPDSDHRGIPTGLLAVVVDLGVESREELSVRVAADLVAWHREVLDSARGVAVRPSLTDWTTFVTPTHTG